LRRLHPRRRSTESPGNPGILDDCNANA